jgi:alpha-amylase/alpha-mannosidase (GH57 family)
MFFMPALIIHGHFYQPPRENPWSGIIEEQPSAAPFHDWNERIHAECYRPNSAVVVTFPNGETSALNNYEHISFNFGPTLLSWLDQHHRSTYNRIIAADRQSVIAHAGHGNAIAQAYGHAILPLCNERDLRTQIRWGLADFRYRFERDAEAMWLPETACNERVLSALIDEGMCYVILAPHQARYRSANDNARDKAATRELNEIEADVLDPSIPYQYSNRDGDGSIAVFLYDGSTSRAIAFEHLLKSSRDLVDAFVRSLDNRPMLNVATDGETYGHHFKFGDLCLAHALTNEAPARGFTVTNYSAYLDQHPPEVEVEINDGPAGEGTSWSCPHGLGRWNRDCGCRTGGKPDWNQAWRKPLRAALDFLRDENIDPFEATRGKLFTFPWLARDESISLILDPLRSREHFLFEHAGRRLSSDERWRALTYLELQRMLLLMYTSCGWFFNDISGIETIQILKYAARALDLMAQLGLPSVRDRFLEILGQAKSNRRELGNGADIFRRFVEPSNPTSSGNTVNLEALVT